MITAVEAREMVFVKNSDLIKKQMDEIEIKINEAVNHGEFNCNIDFSLHKAVIYKLRRMGYNVISSGGMRKNTKYSIDWY